MRSLLASGAALVLLAAAARAQCSTTASLATPFNSNGGQAGNIFDIEVTASGGLQLTGLAVNTTVSGTVHLFLRRNGTHVGYEHDPSAWIWIGAGPVTSAGFDVPSAVGGSWDIYLAPGTHALYISMTGSGMRYTTGTSVGATLVQDADLTIREGVGLTYPFGSLFSPRAWNGRLDYTSCSSAGAIDFQPNSAALSADVDGAVANPYLRPARIALNVGETATFTLSSELPGTVLYDLAISGVVAVGLSSGGLSLGADSIVNVDILQPLAWMHGGAVTAWTQMPGTSIPGAHETSFSITFPALAPGVVTLQAVALDPTSASGVQLTQANEVTTN